MAMTKRSVAELNIGELECKNRCLAERKGFKARLVAQAPQEFRRNVSLKLKTYFLYMPLVGVFKKILTAM